MTSERPENETPDEPETPPSDGTPPTNGGDDEGKDEGSKEAE